VGRRNKRRSKDKMIENGGKELIDWAQRKEWSILNGSTKEDRDGEYTYVGYRGNMVIDYVIANEGIKKHVREFAIGDRMDSDHMPLLLSMKGEEEKQKTKEEKKK